MLTSAQFEARENEVFAALKIIAKHRPSRVADVEIEDDESFAVLADSKHVTGSFKLDFDDTPNKARLLTRLGCRAERVSPTARLSISYTAEAPAAFPFIFAKGTAEYKDRASLTREQRQIIGEHLHKYMYAPDYINYYSNLMVFKTPQGFDAALAALLEHIDELDLGSVVTLIGRRVGSALPEQLWPK